MEDHKINEFPRPPEASDWAQDALVPKKPPFSALPENTSMQRAVKKYLCEGGHFYAKGGVFLP